MKDDYLKVYCPKCGAEMDPDYLWEVNQVKFTCRRCGFYQNEIPLDGRKEQSD